VCGIAGVMMRGGAPVEQAVLSRLAEAMAHRGPDGSGFHVRDNVGFAHTRLAIIDLETGDQPFIAPDGVALIANGEIYNDPELRLGLADAPFATGSDCESPLHLYRAEGLDFADDLRGMYAIAIHDPARGRLVLARDPFGIKPLYYVQNAQGLAFASEPQALIAAGLAGRTLRPHARAELLQLKFTTGADTIYADIQRVEPGETLVIEDGQVTERRRRAMLPKAGPVRASTGSLAQQLDAVLLDTVAHHLRSDVPYGLFLSGGIDSAVLVALMARLSSQPVFALTAGFPGSAAADETAQAARVARAVGAEHHVVEMTARDFWSLAPRIAAALDDPCADGAALPSFMLARAARGRLKVVLNGAGADEIFGGYTRYRRARWLGPLAGASRTHGVFGPGFGKAPALDGWRAGLAAVDRAEAGHGRTRVQALQAVDSAQWLPNDVLLVLDRCLMAHGVEGRTPFLDPPTADFAFRLPDGLKIRGRFGKWLLRDWLAKAVPESAAFARKTGFVPPVGEWIAAHGPGLEDLVAAQPGVAETFSRDFVRAVLTDAAANAQAAWSLLFYALWHSRHVLEVNPDGNVDEVLAQAARAG
jgi:asparagine synthase (glutamine-hydrolysing)